VIRRNTQHSVRRKLFAGVLLTSLVALLVSGAALFAYDLHSYRDWSGKSLMIEAELLGNVSSAALQFDDPAVATQNLTFLGERATVRAAAIYKPTGALFATYTRKDVPKSEIPPLAGLDGVAMRGDSVSVVRRIGANGEIVGMVYLAEDLDVYGRIGSYAAIALGVMAAALVVAALLSEWLQQGITRPIIQVSELARQVVDKRDYTLRASRTTHDEIGTLVDAFNEMLSEIEKRTAALELSNAEVVRLNKDLERRVTERTAELEESNLQLRSANLAKSSFLSMMSHEIRTPMNGVLGLLELMSLSALDSAQRTTLETVRESGRSLLRIIDDILDFSKIEAGKLEIVPEVCSIAKVVANVVGTYSGNASSKSLLLTAKVDERISPAVVVDPLRLQQILNNLVSNAIKFTSRGFVEIRAELVAHEEGKDVVLFTVTDSGIGIEAGSLAALFQPFSQAGGKVAHVFGGTGLGLSIGQRLAGLMNGKIEIASRHGEGTRVAMTLPLPVAAPGAAPAEESRPSSAAVADTVLSRRQAPTVEEAEAEGTLVLVVDDHPVNRILLTRQVTVLGYASECATNGREAFAMWQTGRFRLVLTDCNMPEMDGYELSRSIRARERAGGKGGTLIIACTANALKGEAENCFAAGMNDYIAKPVELTGLLMKLQQWLPIPGEAEPRMRAHRSPADDGAGVPIERSVLAEVSGGDAALEQQIFGQFAQNQSEDLVALEAAYGARDLPGVVRGSHRIKGASASIGARMLAQAAGRVEAAGRANDWGGIDGAWNDLRREAARLSRYLDSIAAQAES
jgi:signal transduction histidine kinase/DNA-binding response OmpR family regulator